MTYTIHMLSSTCNYNLLQHMKPVCNALFAVVVWVMAWAVLRGKMVLAEEQTLESGHGIAPLDE